MYKLAIFDLDGTLINSLPDLTTALNYALRECGFPQQPREKMPYLVGNGKVKLVERAVPIGTNKQAKEKVLGLYQQYYEKHPYEQTFVYPGIKKMLSTLLAKGVKVAICTNKPKLDAQKIVAHFFADVDFCALQGDVPELPCKPDPQKVFSIMKKAQVRAEETLFIGDSDVDMQTALNSGVVAVGVLWGFRSERELRENGTKYLLRVPADLEKIVDEN